MGSITRWTGVAAGMALALAAPANAKTPHARTDVVRAGPARFEVLTPTLIRMEYAQDRRFQDAATMTATRASLPRPRFTKRMRHGWLTIRTRRVTLSYRLGSGAFTLSNVRLKLGRRKLPVHPVAGSTAGNLGGWTRALDNQDAPVPLHPGAISTAGWYVLDDTSTALLTSTSPGFAVRPAHTGPYQDWYLFAYGHDYARGLTDLQALSGPAPLLPRSAFGVWFSRYYPYSESDYHALLAQFRSAQVPLDTLSIDTDFKRENSAVGAVAAANLAGAPGRPYSWNGWEWDTQLFPAPQRFIDWAHSQGLSLAINIHPSIDSTDPRYPATVAQGGPLTADSGCRLLQADPLGTCMTFDWHDARQLAAYFALHAPFAQQGIDLFWLDWCCDGPQQSVPGLTDDTWINSRYSAEQRARGSRWPAFSRIGGGFAESGAGADGPDNDRAAEGAGAFAEHRYTIQFTGDTCATWPMLRFEAQLSASEGNIGLPYVSNDIGGYNGASPSLPCGEQDIAVVPGATATHHLPDDLYARWVQFGTFQPLDRLHSNHGDRLPWEYGAAADRSATSFLQLREELNPYIYTLARRAYDTGLPLTGGLYLQWPRQSDAYRYPSEYTFGPDMVVEPVTAPGDPAPATIWVPPGTWTDYFTGQRFIGPRAVTLSVPLSQMPVLVRAGALIPTQPYVPSTAAGPAGAVTVSAFPGGRGHFALYDDQGRGFGYQHGLDSWTPISQRRRGRRFSVKIGAARGHFPGSLRVRTWQLRVIGVRRPKSVRVNGHRRPWSYDVGARTVTVSTGSVSTNRPVSVTAR